MNSENRLTDEMEKPFKHPQRGIYLLPNLFTTFALFCGFYAIIAAMKQNFESAAIAILVAMVADSLDGRVARMTHTQTAFGAQYDSLSDLVAFGTAPALVMYSWCFGDWGKMGWLICFLYVAGTALRLARFNTQSSDKHYFRGLPCPTPAGFIAAGIWLCIEYGISAEHIRIFAAFSMIALAALMVSTFSYSSFKSIDFKGRVPFMMTILVVLSLGMVAIAPPQTLWVVFSIYILTGPLLALSRFRKKRRELKNIATS